MNKQRRHRNSSTHVETQMLITWADATQFQDFITDTIGINREGKSIV